VGLCIERIRPYSCCQDSLLEYQVRLQPKRRRLWLLTLPVVIAVGFLLVIGLAVWHRSVLLADLAASVSSGETHDAIEAVQKLAALPNPPMPLLVKLAASENRATAGAAQSSIDRLLHCWQRDVERTKRFTVIASQLSELAKSLAEARAAFSDSDSAWLESTVRQMLQIANEFPSVQAPLVAAHCDLILAAIEPGGFSKTSAELHGKDVIENAVPALPAPSMDSQSLSAVSTGVEREPRVGLTEKTTSIENMPPHKPSVSVPILHRNDGGPPGSIRDTVFPNDLRSRADVSADNTSPDRRSSVLSLPHRSDAAPPILRIVPASPINTGLDGQATHPRADSKVFTGTSGGLYVGIESRELLSLWLASEQGDVSPIERELNKRGFGTLSKSLVRQFFADDPQVRMRVIDRSLAQPGGGSEAWLLLLANDADPDVRLFAVTFMATSNNAALVEKAWQVAIRDQDPRVADMAGRLRERRERPLRR